MDEAPESRMPDVGLRWKMLVTARPTFVAVFTSASRNSCNGDDVCLMGLGVLGGLVVMLFASALGNVGSSKMSIGTFLHGLPFMCLTWCIAF